MDFVGLVFLVDEKLQKGARACSAPLALLLKSRDSGALLIRSVK